LPVFIRLGELKPEMTLEAHIVAQLGELGPHYHTLLTEKRLALLLDGLNELPSQSRSELAGQVRTLIQRCQQEGMVAAITCRELDYVGDLEMNILQQVTITPLDPLRIRQFVNAYLKEPPDAGEEMFWQLAGGEAQKYWRRFTEDVGDDQYTFWIADKLPARKNWWQWMFWLELRDLPRSMMTLAHNPYMLYMMTQVFTEEACIPQNRGKLFQLFVDFLLLQREKLNAAAAETLKSRLSDLAYEMQAKGEAGTSSDRTTVLHHLQDEQTLYRAQSANILSGTDEIRFTHQLLQEYFAAHKLDAERQAGKRASVYWPSENWWEPQGWEETAILLAGLYNNDCTPIIEWLRDANPELAMRCVVESGAFTPEETIQNLRPHWLPRLTDLTHDPALQARASIGRAVGRLKLDNRPDMVSFSWCAVLAGRFTMGGDKEARSSWAGAEYDLPYSFWMAKYPVTYAQYKPFVAADGYRERRYWTEAGWANKGARMEPFYWNDPQWHVANHPVVGVTWYEAYAYTQWLNEQQITKPPDAPGNYVIRLPRECEWEKAARYPDGRLFPWGNEWNPTRLNGGESGIGRTSAVGIFPDGANPAHGACDLLGNVDEWCLTEWAGIYSSPEAENNNPQGNFISRCLRGGCWLYPRRSYFRAAARGGDHSGAGEGTWGFRVVLSVPIEEL
jgi:formylglycine-generating enzyme required for sulfatase activity